VRGDTLGGPSRPGQQPHRTDVRVAPPERPEAGIDGGPYDGVHEHDRLFRAQQVSLG